MLARILANKLEHLIDTYPAVALLGARQVGKTTLSKHLQTTRESVYLDLESAEDMLKLNDSTHFLRSQNDKLIILDEIQRAPELFSVLRGLIDQSRQQGKMSGQFLLLGSASMALLRQSSESLAGRIHSLEMTGFNALEVAHHQSSLETLWLRGGYPESFLAHDNQRSMEWLEDLIRTYLERDIPQMGFRISSVKLRRLWTMLAHLQGETLNTSKLATNLEERRSMINQYLDILTDLLLVRRIEPWFVNVKKRLVKSPRYYIRDTGIVHRLLGIHQFDMLLSHPILGKSWEGFVIENLYSVMPRLAETYFYRTSAGAEIDLVIKHPNAETWAIEIKHGTAPKLSKHFHRTCNDIEATHRYVIYGGHGEFPVGHGVHMISLTRMMEKLLSLRF